MSKELLPRDFIGDIAKELVMLQNNYSDNKYVCPWLIERYEIPPTSPIELPNHFTFIEMSFDDLFVLLNRTGDLKARYMSSAAQTSANQTGLVPTKTSVIEYYVSKRLLGTSSSPACSMLGWRIINAAQTGYQDCQYAHLQVWSEDGKDRIFIRSNTYIGNPIVVTSTALKVTPRSKEFPITVTDIDGADPFGYMKTIIGAERYQPVPPMPTKIASADECRKVNRIRKKIERG